MGAVHLSLDQRTLDRIEALAMLQREARPGVACHPEDAARQALHRGLDQMLAELLAHPAARPQAPERLGIQGRT